MVAAYQQAVAREKTEISAISTSPYVKNFSEDRKRALVELLPKDREVRILKFSQSLCPGCVDEEKWDGMKIDSVVFVMNDKVWMTKQCAEHGPVTEVYWGDWEMYRKAERFQDPGIRILNPNIDKSEFEINCPVDCGLCVEHESHTGLGNVVLTNRCDLTCWYCLPYNVEVPFKVDGKVEIRKIGEVAELFLKNFKEIEVNGIKGIFGKASGVEVLTIENGKHVWIRVNKFLKRKYTGDFIKIKTKTGKEIKTTVDHKFILNNLKRKHGFELEKSDKVLSIANIETSSDLHTIDLFESFKSLPKEEAEKLYVKNSHIFEQLDKLKNSLFDLGINPELAYSWKARDTVPLNTLYALDYPVNGISFGVDAKSYEVSRFLEVTPELSKIIGYFVSDGHYSGKKLCITAGDKWVREDIKNCLNKLDITYSIVKSGNKAEQIFIGNKIFYLIFKYVLNIPRGASNKRLPKQFLNFDLNSKISLLSGLFNGDGFVEVGERHGSLGYGTVSKNLATDLSYLLANIGIDHRVYERNMDNNKLANYNLYRFYISSENLEKMKALLSFKQSHLDKLSKIGERKKSKLEKLGDFIVDEIKEIVTIKNSEKQYVYDLEVDSDSHCFVAGDGILISNCFFYAKENEPIYEPTLDQIKFMLKRMRDVKPVGCNAVQLTGGEPTLRDDLIDIVKAAKEIGYDHVQLNTNGINLSKSPELCANLREAGAHVLYMSFDGMTPETNPKNYWEAQRALANCKKAGIGIVLVPTVIGGVNDHELGDIIRFGFGNINVVRSVNFQPVSLVGRMPDKLRRMQRITIPGAIKKIEEQTGGEIGRENWFPVPCAKQITDFVEALKDEPKYRLSIHFACGMATYVFRDGNRIVPLPKFFDIEGFFNYLGELTRELQEAKVRDLKKPWVLAKLMWNINKFVDNKAKPKDLKFAKMFTSAVSGTNYHGLSDFHHNSLFLGMMHFQDPYNWDLDRIHKCDIHYAVPDGRILPFCTFNVIPALYRDKVQRKFSIPAEEWEKKTGKKLEDDRHHRKLSKEEMLAIKESFDQFRKNKTRQKTWTDWGEDFAQPTAPVPVPVAQHGSISQQGSGLVQIGKVVAAALKQKEKPTTEHPAGGGCYSGSCGRKE